MQTNPVSSSSIPPSALYGAALPGVDRAAEKSAQSRKEDQGTSAEVPVPIRGLDPMKVYAYWMLKNTEWPGACGKNDDAS